KRGRHQGVGDQPGSRRDRAFEPEHDLVKVVEGANRHQPHAAALGRLRVDVIEMPEGGRIFKLSEQRQAVPPCELALAVLNLRLRRGAEKRHALEDGQQSCKKASAEEDSAGQAQGKPPGEHARGASCPMSDDLTVTAARGEDDCTILYCTILYK